MRALLLTKHTKNSYVQVRCIFLEPRFEFFFILFVGLLDSDLNEKHKIFELLSALCVYSHDGYKSTIEILNLVKTQKNERNIKTNYMCITYHRKYIYIAILRS